jgi:hypothetical protein
MRITPVQEEVLVEWLEDLQRQVLPSNYATIRELVVQLLLENDDLEPFGIHWTIRFLKRHSLLEISYGRPMGIQRLLALNSSIITPYFNKVAGLHLQRWDLEDIWNIDENVRGDRTSQLHS